MKKQTLNKQYKITMTFGSEFQQSVWEKCFDIFLFNLQSMIESKHNKNKLKIEVTTKKNL